MAVNPTAGFIECKSCAYKLALKKTSQGHYSGDCDGCGFRHFFPDGTPCHRKIGESMQPYVDPFAAPAPSAKAPAPAKIASKGDAYAL